VDFPQNPALLIIKLAHAMGVEIDRRLKEHGITTSQWSVLKQLWQQEGRSQSELQDRLGLDRATVAGLVQRMTQQDLIVREPDPDDKRIQRVFLTDKGRALKGITTALVEQVNANAIEGFSPEERAIFMGLLKRALQNCERD
jgi:DNA-binding MarR family transcriptional regulator